MSSRRPVFAANWKMNTTVAEGIALVRELRERLVDVNDADVVICPPFTHLVPLQAELRTSALRLGAQNAYWEPKGAYTGEISVSMLTGVVEHVILGHSERRLYFGETDADVNRKLRAVLGAGLVPIVCVGETQAQRDSGEMEGVLRRQVGRAVDGVSLSGPMLLAYEPVWAIGTGSAAHGPQAQDAIAFIRAQLRQDVGADADRTAILYGGSVSPANIAEFMTQPDVDGALVGGASLSADSFAEIVRAGSVAALRRVAG